MQHSSNRLIRWSSLLLLGSLPALTGCLSAAAQAYYEIRGAGGEVKPIDAPAAESLAAFNSVEFAPATSRLPAKFIPSPLIRAYDDACREMGEKLVAHMAGGPPALRVESEIVFFQEKGLLSSALMLDRVRLFDGSRQIGDLLVQTESRSFRAGDEKPLAQASVRALIDYLARLKGVPEEERKKIADD